MIRVLFSAIFLLSGIVSFGQYAGNQVFNSLNIPGSARIAALGGTYMPVQDNDLELGIFNPSVLDSTLR